jgi:hypothetical protein
MLMVTTAPTTKRSCRPDFLRGFNHEKSQESTKKNLGAWQTTHPLVDLGFSRFENNTSPVVLIVLVF